MSESNSKKSWRSMLRDLGAESRSSNFAESEDFGNPEDNVTDKNVEVAMEKEVKTKASENLSDDKHTTTVGSGTVISGDMSVTGDLNIYGVVKGNIVCTGKVICNGAKITGDINADDVALSCTEITGNVVSNSGLTSNSQTVIVGNVWAKDVAFNGSIKGNIKSADSIRLGVDAVVVGDVETTSLNIAKGSKFTGNVKMTSGDETTDSWFKTESPVSETKLNAGNNNIKVVDKGIKIAETDKSQTDKSQAK